MDRLLPWIYGLLELFQSFLSILHLMDSSVRSAMFLLRAVFGSYDFLFVSLM